MDVVFDLLTIYIYAIKKSPNKIRTNCKCSQHGHIIFRMIPASLVRHLLLCFPVCLERDVSVKLIGLSLRRSSIV